MSMFCFQCQETAKGTGCTIKGVCGKSDDLANMMDLLMFVTKGICVYSTALREQKGYENPIVNKFVFDSLFTTITNANFDKQVISNRVSSALEIRETLRNEASLQGVRVDTSFEGCTWSGTPAEYEAKAALVGVLSEKNEDIRSLKELITYGVKGMAAYTEHAYNLGHEDVQNYAFMQRALASITRNLSVDELVALTLETGKFGVNAMALLDKANTSSFGNPEITKVNLGVRSNPGILISGHDLKDMEELLAQTEGTGVDVYTHSEMLPANYYPAFKKYRHFVGNYGSSWWHQREDFETFNGPILFTTNCIVPPLNNATYKDRIFTTGAAGYPGSKHVADRKPGQQKDFSEIIALAKTCKAPTQIETGEIIGGFAHAQVFALADKVVDAVKSGAIRKFVVMAGCDGRMKDRTYYTEFAQKLPKDTVILTA